MQKIINLAFHSCHGKFGLQMRFVLFALSFFLVPRLVCEKKEQGLDFSCFYFHYLRCSRITRITYFITLLNIFLNIYNAPLSGLSWRPEIDLRIMVSKMKSEMSDVCI